LPEESVKDSPLGRLEVGYVKERLDEAIGGIAVKVTGVIGIPTVRERSTGPPINWSRSGRIWMLIFAETTCPNAFEATNT
jgi:hypothetical protein